MTVLEMQSRTQPALRWTEVCAPGHATVGPPVRSGGLRTVAERAPLNEMSPGRIQAPARGVAPARSLAPGREVLIRPASSQGVRACRIDVGTETAVVDDVPAWVLLACGIAFGVVLLLALALLGGPAYA